MKTSILLEPLMNETAPLEVLSSMSAILPVVVSTVAVEVGISVGTWLAN